MKVLRLHWLLFAVLVLLGGVFGSAETYTTNIINTLTNSGDAYYVGNTGPFNVLIVTNAGVLINTNGFIGNTAAASNNTALIAGSGSIWTNVNFLFVGNYGAGNQLRIINGGHVVNADGRVGQEPGASNNVATVSDSGSAWVSDNNIDVGYYGAGNQLIVTNGGQVFDFSGFVGKQLGADNNVAIITGSSSLWNNAFQFTIGFYSTGNRLTIINSGQVVTDTGYVGLYPSASNNTITVSGSGSVWRNVDNFYIGHASVGNQLIITNGGKVVNNLGYLGYQSGTTNNTVIVTGSGSLWTNASDLEVGYYGAGNQLTIINSGQVVNSDGYVGYDAGGKNNAVTVSGSGSVWKNVFDLFLGFNGSGNRLTITNSGLVTHSDAHVGNNAGSTNNTAIVTDNGSLWNIVSGLYLGVNGAGNQLTILNSGRVVDHHGVIGYYASSSNNAVTVSGSGSLWTTSSDLYVGYESVGNQMTVSNGGVVVVNGNAYIGYNATSSDNQITVVNGSLFVTNASAPIQLDIRRGTLRLDSGTVTVSALSAKYGANSVIIFNGGTLRGKNISISNTVPFVVGDGTHSATLDILVQGTNRFANGLIISTNAMLSGNGTITGDVVVNGTIQTGTGLRLVFTGVVTNNGTLRAINNGILETYDTFVNNGVIDVIYGSTNFHSTFINNGIILTADGDNDGDGMSNLQESQAGTCPTNSSSCLRVTSVAREGSDVRITWTAVGGKSYVVQTNSVPGNGFADFSSPIYVPGTGESTTNYLHTGGVTNVPALFYRVRLGP